MRHRLIFGFILGLTAAGGFSSARASVLVDYAVTFTGASAADDGTGVLVLNLPSLPDASIPFTSLPNSIFSSLQATIGGVSFTLTNSNITGGGLQGVNPNTPQSSNLTIALQETQSLPNGTHYLDLFNGGDNAGTFMIGTVNDAPIASGSYALGAPVMAAVPESATWAMMLLGFLGISLLAYRRRGHGLKFATARKA